MLLEHVSLSLNPRGTLYRNRYLIEISDLDSNPVANTRYLAKLDESPWAVYRVRRVYNAAKNKAGTPSLKRKVRPYAPSNGSQAIFRENRLWSFSVR